MEKTNVPTNSDAAVTERLIAEASAKASKHLVPALNAARDLSASITVAIFAAMRELTGPTFAKTVFAHVEKEWRKANATKDENGDTWLPKLNESYSATRSKMLGDWEKASHYADLYRNFCVSNGMAADEIPETFLNVKADRYSGKNGSRLWSSDYAKAKNAEKTLAAQKKEREKEAAKARNVEQGKQTAAALASGGDVAPAYGPDTTSALEGFNAELRTALNAGLADKVLATLIRETAAFLRDQLKDAKALAETTETDDAPRAAAI